MSPSNSLTPEEEDTVSWYDAHANEWATQHFSEKTTGALSREIPNFHKVFPAGRLLEIGCGTGRDAKELIALGYDYVGTDPSEVLLVRARELNPGATFLPVSVYDLDFPTHSFDGFWAYASLLHMSPDRLPQAFKRIREVVKPGGKGYIAMKERMPNEENGTDETGRYFSYYDSEEFAGILADNGFTVDAHHSTPVAKKDGYMRTWLAYHVTINKK